MSGRVVAADTELPVPSAAVALYSAAGSRRVAQTLTGADGAFRFDRLPGGEYQLRIESIGFTAVTQVFELAAGETRQLGTLMVQPDAVALEPIEVSTQRSAVTEEADRTAYNVGVMPGTEGGSATDALEMIPELEVDLDGNITLLGDAPAIYINGRPAPLRGESLAAFLEQLPAEYLERIEVLENPSARFDARGSGGVINLVMKEGVELGLSGNIFANAGSRGRYGLGGRVTAQRGDLTLNGGTFLRYSDSERSTYDLRQNLSADPAFLEQDSRTDRSGLSGSVDLQANYDATDRLRLFGEGRLRHADSDAIGVTTTTHMDSDEAPFLIFDRLSTLDARSLDGNVALGFDYQWEPRAHQLEFEVEVRSGREQDDSRRELRAEMFDTDDTAAVPPALTLERDDELEREVNLSLDYTRPLGESVRIELGARSELGRVRAERLLRFLEDPAAAPLDTEPVDRGFEQHLSRYAVYGTLQRRFGALSAQVGLRAERTDLSLDVPGVGPLERAYTDYFPSANLAYRIDSARQLRLSYSRRIGLPSASVLNPIDVSTDPLERRVGNPDVTPRFTHRVSLRASWSTQYGSLRLSPYYRLTTNDWTRITTVDDTGVSSRTYLNVASRTSYGANLTWSMRRQGAVSGNVSIGGRQNVRDASNLARRYSGRSFRWSSRANLNARLSPALSVQGNLRYSPPTDLPQGRSAATYRADFGVRYRLLDDRASIRLSLRDPFGLRRSSSRMQDVSYVQIGRSKQSTRSVRLSISYALGGR